jgi:hypothetical protein
MIPTLARPALISSAAPAAQLTAPRAQHPLLAVGLGVLAGLALARLLRR